MLLAIGLVGVTVLILQIALSRLLSATVGHHFSFAIIALVMLGLAASATNVFLRRGGQRPPTLEDASTMLIRAAVALVVGVFGFVGLGLLPLGSWYTGGGYTPVHILAAGGLFFGTFWLTGWVVAFLLAEYHEDVARVYWCDLSGAALGCLLAVPLLDVLSAQNVVLACGVPCAGAALLLALTAGGTATRRAGITLAGISTLVLLAAVWPPMTALRMAKGQDQRQNLWVGWNHLARVNVTANVPGAQQAVDILIASDPEVNAQAIVNRWQMGWGMSDRYEGDAPEILWVQLDAGAGTQIIKDGPQWVGRDQHFLEADVTSAGHHVVRDHLERAFVIGGGGGRDVLAALHFGAERVHVVELNPDVVRAVNEQFVDFSGGTYSLPQVQLEIGDARNVLSRSEDRYDLIQMSMIDSFASSITGSMVMSENGLYTTEAFALYLEHLEEDGVLSVSRWYHPVEYGTTAKVISLMRYALHAAGVEDPGAHIALIYARSAFALNVSTAVMKRTPFTPQEIRALRNWSDESGFRTLWPDPEPEPDDRLEVDTVLRGDPASWSRSHLDLSPPDDDRPFFFNTRRPFASWVVAIRSGDSSLGSKSSMFIILLLVVFLILSDRIVTLPLHRWEARKAVQNRTRLREYVRPVAYFAGIGLGFMWVEIAVIQRYIVFLGHPTYALSVVLFALLLFGGLGSALSTRLPIDAWRVSVGVVTGAVLLTALAVPWVTEAAYALPKGLRITMAVALVAPLALFMGTMYPLGVRLLERARVPELVPWLWAVNGVCGVFAAVTGMFVAMSWGFTAVLFLGAAAYGMTAWAATGPFSPLRALPLVEPIGFAVEAQSGETPSER